MTNMLSLCVLCGSRDGGDPAFREATVRLGHLMARRGVRLVYGGGSIGLMGILADSVLAAGGEVIGIIPDFLIRREVGHRRLTDLIVTTSMHDRKRRMFEMADAFVILPGGLGTLDETFEIVTWKQIKLHDAPIVVLDVNGYWEPLKALIDATITGEFAHASVRELVTFVTTPEAVFDELPVTHQQTREEILTSQL
ncbi:LOG family protein [Defluviicoccus vanus]|uniref:Cytokinin riboside 5'-monophosphate phosphoribohydrolase n=1 Tax=Defluviicoccus vanus TaxID=111831 RepID=A0A7H1N2N0_9PROT|nr:TIGR00730 family Rossman fold protein [Defluviicoccus vanus]QNT69966.1 TIGR00730 family Rossman fold protein [Defluviicoccus vanus]